MIPRIKIILSCGALYSSGAISKNILEWLKCKSIDCRGVKVVLITFSCFNLLQLLE
jgi:hypothetical protein